jgi:hypothetical protein
MADIRIKDLTTTASSTASDDFFAADGTTNGTRKLSAFSPSFGGNATVGGTLTVNGKIALATGTTSAIGVTFGDLDFYRSFSSILSTTAGTLNGGVGVGYFSINSAGSQPLVLSANNVEGARVTATGNVLVGGSTDISGSGGLKVFGTTASTSTSSGALVVGNGTSGGLGVGGAASIGGPILVGTSSDVYVSRVGTGILDIRSASSPGTTARLDVTGTTSAGVGFRQSGARDWFISAESNELRVSCLTAASIFAFNSGTPVAMRDTTASTSTSSGALVVSGGVGVAGAIYAGGLLSSSATTSLDGLPTAGIFGGTKRVALGYNTSGDYGFVACADSGTTWKELHLNPLGGLVKVPQSTASNDAYTGAFVVGGGVGAAGAVNAGTFFGLVDGVTAPATGSGYARIYVDSADGDLKVKFGDGTVKTIATDS